MVFVIVRSLFMMVFDRIDEVRWHDKTNIKGAILQIDDSLAKYINFKPSSTPEIILFFVQDYFQSIFRKATDWYHISASDRVQNAIDKCSGLWNIPLLNIASTDLFFCSVYLLCGVKEDEQNLYRSNASYKISPI